MLKNNRVLDPGPQFGEVDAARTRTHANLDARP